MACWSENYHFIKEVYDFRVEEMNKWMDALEESSKKLITNKVYTSREFRRMRDQFRYQCKNLRREELKQWLHEMLKLLNQKSDQNLETEKKRLEALIQRHTEVLPGIEENMRKVDVYSRCYQYVDDITPLLKLLEDLRRKSTEDEHDKKPDQGGIKIHPDSTEQVTTFIENQEANIAKVEEKRGEIAQLLKRGEKLEGQADCPDFLKEQVKGLSELFVDTEKKAKLKLEVLRNNEKAWQEYEEDKVSMVNLLDQADEKLRNIRKLFDPQQGAEDLAMRTDQAARTREACEACFNKLKGNVEIICSICSPDKKEELGKIMTGFEERMAVLNTTDERINKLKAYTADLQTFVDKKEASLKWLVTGENQLVELMKFPGEDKSDEKLLMTVKMQKDMETQLNILSELITESERLLGGKTHSVAENHLLEVERVKNKLEELNLTEESVTYAERNRLPIDCTWRVTVTPGKEIQVYFKQFSLAKPNECELNFVEILSGPELLLRRKQHFCSSKAESVKMGQDNDVTFRFYAARSSLVSAKTRILAVITEMRLRSSEEQCLPTEFDCDDLYCINRSLVCNGNFNCDKLLDEKADCDRTSEQHALAFLTTNSNIVIMTIGCGLLFGMCFSMCWNCIRKLRQDFREKQESVRRPHDDGALLRPGRGRLAADPGCYVPSVELKAEFLPSPALNGSLGSGVGIVREETVDTDIDTAEVAIQTRPRLARAPAVSRSASRTSRGSRHSRDSDDSDGSPPPPPPPTRSCPHGPPISPFPEDHYRGAPPPPPPPPGGGPLYGGSLHCDLHRPRTLPKARSVHAGVEVPGRGEEGCSGRATPRRYRAEAVIEMGTRPHSLQSARSAPDVVVKI